MEDVVVGTPGPVVDMGDQGLLVEGPSADHAVTSQFVSQGQDLVANLDLAMSGPLVEGHL